MIEPDYYYRFEQGKQNVTIGSGICYGICLYLAKKIRNKNDTGSVYETLSGELKNNRTRVIQSGISKQKHENQDRRKKTSVPLPTGRPLIIMCNTNADSGYCSRYSILSYVNPFSWFGNHACLLWHNEEGTVIFDPNSGLTGWKKIHDPDFSDLQDMLDWGYKRIKSPRPVYVWGAQLG